MSYLSSAIEVSIESLAIKAAPHQLDVSTPPAFAVAVWSLVKTLHWAGVRLDW